MACHRFLAKRLKQPWKLGVYIVDRASQSGQVGSLVDSLVGSLGARGGVGRPAVSPESQHSTTTVQVPLS